jgi:glycosyltransferase involved in cell wall biosynthesis
MFNIASKFAWWMQKLAGIPYLNFFFNYRYMDACLKVLPGHDIVYERNGLYNSGLAMASRKLGLPYTVFFEADQIMELDTMGKPVTGLLRWRAKQILRYNLNAADCIICVSEEGREHLYTEWKVPMQKMVVFPNAVNVEKFKPNPATRAAIRRSLNFETNPIVLFLGNFFHWHDVPTLLSAFNHVLKSYPATRLVLVGDGEHRSEMERRADELGLLHAVRFIGIVPHPEAPKYVAAADIAVVPYPSMQQKMWLSPLKLFEYMASGNAVVASAVGQINQVIQDRRNGLLVPPGDSAALADALTTLIENPDLRHALGTRARYDAESKYSWDHYIIRLEHLFKAIIARQPFDFI